KATSPSLKTLAEDLAKPLEANFAIVSSVAEMHSIKSPSVSPSQQRLLEKLEKLSGPKRDKVLLDMFIEIDERMAATYDLGRKSKHPTIFKLSEAAFEQTQQH